MHLLRNSLDFAHWKERKPLAAALRPIYTAASADAALLVLDDFERGPWGVRFPTVVAAWKAGIVAEPLCAHPGRVCGTAAATSGFTSARGLVAIDAHPDADLYPGGLPLPNTLQLRDAAFSKNATTAVAVADPFNFKYNG